MGNCIGQYQTNGSQLGNEYIISGRVDYNLSDKDHLFLACKDGPRHAADLGGLHQPGLLGQQQAARRTMDRGQWTSRIQSESHQPVRLCR